jgi:nucleotide-binding universal stress UspA family protein
MGVIVVGVDQSAGSLAALRFALEEARLRDATLRIVHAWQYGYIGAGFLEGSYPLVGADIKELQDAGEAELDARVREAIPNTGDVAIERRVLEGRPAAILVEQSLGADLLVVGSRGHGGFAELLLGSVSHQCASHAKCPVVVVRASSGNSK